MVKVSAGEFLFLANELLKFFEENETTRSELADITVQFENDESGTVFVKVGPFGRFSASMFR